MPPPLTRHCGGARCGGPVPAYGATNGRRRFGARPGAFGPWGNRPAPVVPPPIVGAAGAPSPSYPPGVPSPIHPPAPPPIVPSPIAPPPIAPPPIVPPTVGSAPSAGYVADRRTHAPAIAPPGYPPAPGYPSNDPPAYPPMDPYADPYADPMAVPSYDMNGDVAWSDGDDGAAYVDPSWLASGNPAWELWQGMVGSYLETRNARVSESGETFPDTTAGDVKRASLVLSRELCLPRYDFADLVATRAAWRDALARVHVVCAALPWNAPYPENERFWLTDARALAQRLATIDQRRNALVGTVGGVLTILGDRSDPVTTWQDVRAFYMQRRIVKTDTRGWRYPETTVQDARDLVHVFNTDVNETVGSLPDDSPISRWLVGHVRRWRPVADAVKAYARDHDPEATYPDNARLWHAAKKIAVALSSAKKVAGEGFTDVVRDRLVQQETS